MPEPGSDAERFRLLVEEALDSLPDDIASLMDNVEVVVEDEAPPAVTGGLRPGGLLLGLYHGVPLTERGNYHNVLPDKISIYRKPIEAIAKGPDEIRRQVKVTVVHEIAHHFGISDERLHELGWD